MSIGVGEIILVTVILVFFFGASRIPLIARGVGEGIRNFKRSLRGKGEEEGPGGPKELPGGDDH